MSNREKQTVTITKGLSQKALEANNAAMLGVGYGHMILVRRSFVGYRYGAAMIAIRVNGR